MADTTIYDIYKNHKSPNRDQKVVDLINLYYANNTKALTDGVLDAIPKITANDRSVLQRQYEIDSESLRKIQNAKEFKYMRQNFSVLKIGLIISYLETKNRIYLTYLSVLIYGSYMSKYYPLGKFNRALMEYTIMSQDAKTDFKKHGTSLITVVNKKLDTYLDHFMPDIKRGITDKLLREMLASMHTRYNLMVKNLAQKYYANKEDPDVKIMMQYSKTVDGKNVVSPIGIIDAIRSKAISNLEYPQERVLSLCGLVPSNPNKESRRFRGLLLENYRYLFPIMVKLNNAYMDEWLHRNRKNPSIQNFKQKFIPQMSVARNLTKIAQLQKEAITQVVKHTKENPRSISKVNLKQTIAKYVLGNIMYAVTQMHSK